MYSAAGTNGIHSKNRLQRLFRDAQTLRHHGFVNESRFETVGQVAMGLPPELGFVAL
jgi:alkylation response protein AidB-like acyl-CoA dehydrogenase